MIQTLNHSSHLLTKLLIIGSLVCAFKYKEEIKDILAHNSSIQEGVSSLKWLANELRPATEAEKAQHASYAKEQRKRADDLKSVGVNPYVKYVTPEDKEWKEAAEWAGKLKRGEIR